MAFHSFHALEFILPSLTLVHSEPVQSHTRESQGNALCGAQPLKWCHHSGIGYTMANVLPELQAFKDKYVSILTTVSL